LLIDVWYLFNIWNVCCNNFLSAQN